MPAVGEMLRSGREAQSLSVTQVAEATKIKTEHIRDLESGHYDSFAAPVYIRGFVRTYAGMLKLDVPAVMRQLDDELSQTEEFRRPPSLTGRDKSLIDWITFTFSRVNWRIAGPILGVAAATVVLVWGFRAWQTARRADPLADLPPAIYSSNTTHSGEYLPVPAHR